MSSLKSIDCIKKEYSKVLKEKRIMVCSGTGCTSSKSDILIENLKKELKLQGVKDVTAHKTGCFGFCAKGPIVVIDPDEIFYEQVKLEDAKDIVEAVKTNKIVERLLAKENDKYIEKWHELNFYNKQQRIALKNCGKINPESIEEYIAVDGYKALEKALGMTPDEIIEEVKKSGIRGRGGAGFSTGKKWEFTKNAKGAKKFVCCNADEGDPGAFMDRSILEGDPHSVIEAMIIAGYAIGADQGYIYVRAEYPIAVERLNIAISDRKSVV